MTASLLVLVIGLVSSLVVVLGERCGLFQYKVRNTSGQINCVKCPLCPRGHEPALKCFGKLVYQGPIVSTCRRCRPGTYQSLPSYGPCKPCIGCPMHRIVLRNCTHLESGKCGKCCDPGYYFDNVKFHCIQCCKCSNSSKDMVEPQCADVREPQSHVGPRFQDSATDPGEKYQCKCRMGPTDEMHTIKLMDLTTASTIFEQTMKLVPQYRHSINNREIFSIERNERKSETVEFSSEIGVAVSVSIVFLIVVIRVFASQCHKYKRMYKDICGSNHAICEDSSMHSPINANTVVGSEKNSMDVDKDGRTTSPDMLLSSEIINSETRVEIQGSSTDNFTATVSVDEEEVKPVEENHNENHAMLKQRQFVNYGGSKNESSLSAPEIVEYSLITCCCCMTSGGTKENIMKEWKIPWEEIRTAFKSHNFRVQFVEVGRTYLSLEETIKAYLKNLLESECFLCIFLIPRRVEGTSLDDGVLILVFAEETSHHSSKRSYFYGREQSKRIIKSVKGENQIIVDQQICKNESPLQALEIDQYRVVRGFCAVILCHRLQNFKEEIRSVFECLGFRVLFVDMGTTNFSLAEAIKMCFKHQDAKFGCFLCLVLGPRNGGKTLLGDAKPLALQEIANIVGGDKCPSLADKPKVVIWQMDATPDSSCCESMKSINDLFTDVRGHCNLMDPRENISSNMPLSERSPLNHTNTVTKSVSRSSFYELREESADCEMESYAEKGGHFTHISKVIGNAGGTISCKGSSFKLVVPKGALPSETNKELYLRLYMERPYDWEKLKKKGHIVELPVIEIGPPGTEFLKPVELHITNRIGKELKDIEFEYSEHEYSEFSKWQKAKREKTRREAWTKAESEEHHVSYVVEKEETIAYCMHFVCGRKIKKSRSKLIEATVYMSRHSHLENYAALTVYFYEPKEEIYQFVKQKLDTTSIEVANCPKQFVVFSDKKEVRIKLLISGGGWVLHQGHATKAISVSHFFHQEFIGFVPHQDFLLRLEDHTDITLTCSFLVQQFGHKEILIDLKVPLGERFMQTYRYSCTGVYFTSNLDESFDEVVLSDLDYIHETPRLYMENLCFHLSKYISRCYRRVARNLGICENVINRVESDCLSDDAKGICYQLLLEWLKGCSCNDTQSKLLLAFHLQESVYKAGYTFISFPDCNKRSVFLLTDHFVIDELISDAEGKMKHILSTIGTAV